MLRSSENHMKEQMRIAENNFETKMNNFRRQIEIEVE